MATYTHTHTQYILNLISSHKKENYIYSYFKIYVIFATVEIESL